MPKLNPHDLEKWLTAGEKLVRSPIAGMVLNVLAPLLPKAGITETQLAGMRARLEDARQRKEKAKKRAGQ